MANPGDLVSLLQAKSWLSLTNTTSMDAVVTALISAVSTQIQNFIGYPIASATYTKTFNGVGGQKILLPHRSVTSVSSLTINTISIPASVPPSWGYAFDDRFLYLTGGYGYFNDCAPGSFTRGVQNIVVTYTAGYVTVPYDIQQACLNWLGSAYALLGQDPTVKMLRAGDTQINFDLVLTKLGESVQIIPPTILSAILPYRRVAT